jgi:hypothetical protein
MKRDLIKSTLMMLGLLAILGITKCEGKSLTCWDKPHSSSDRRTVRMPGFEGIVCWHPAKIHAPSSTYLKKKQTHQRASKGLGGAFYKVPLPKFFHDLKMPTADEIATSREWWDEMLKEKVKP